MMTEQQLYEIERAHSIVKQPDGSYLCRCGWHLTDVGFGHTMLTILDHYATAS